MSFRASYIRTLIPWACLCVLGCAGAARPPESVPVDAQTTSSVPAASEVTEVAEVTEVTEVAEVTEVTMAEPVEEELQVVQLADIMVVRTLGAGDYSASDDLWADDDTGLDRGPDKVAPGVARPREPSTEERAWGADVGDVVAGTGRSALRATTQVGIIRVLDNGDLGAVQAAVEQYSSQLNACYGARLRTNPALAGRVEIEAAVNVNGRVGSTVAIRNTTGDTELESCLRSKVRGWFLGPRDELLMIIIPITVSPA